MWAQTRNNTWCHRGPLCGRLLQRESPMSVLIHEQRIWFGQKVVRKTSSKWWYPINNYNSANNEPLTARQKQLLYECEEERMVIKACLRELIKLKKSAKHTSWDTAEAANMALNWSSSMASTNKVEKSGNDRSGSLIIIRVVLSDVFFISQYSLFKIFVNRYTQPYLHFNI